MCPSCKTSIRAFRKACQRGDESEAMSIAVMDPDVYNKQDVHGGTGLIWTLISELHSLTRWLLAQPGLDTSLHTRKMKTALHGACSLSSLDWDRDLGAPLDVVIGLVRLSSWETINKKDIKGYTALDYAIQSNHTSAALYLSWLGAECEERNRLSERYFGRRAIKFWGRDATAQEKLCWAIAANMSYMRPLSQQHEELDKEELRALARLFNRHTICRMWGDSSSLLNLAWEKVWHSCPALHTDHRRDAVLPRLTPTSYHNTVNYLAN